VTQLPQVILDEVILDAYSSGFVEIKLLSHLQPTMEYFNYAIVDLESLLQPQGPDWDETTTQTGPLLRTTRLLTKNDTAA
jgi:hypothetical protein